MQNNEEINLNAVEKVAKALEEINDEVIYVGGAIVSLYATDEGADQPRPTSDIDISVKVSTYTQMNLLSERLAIKGINRDVDSEVMYRYKLEDISIDFIPYDNTPLGPTNSWLKPAFEKAKLIEIGLEKISIPPVSLFLASKWEAFQNRGEDPRTSHDFEDIVYVVDNNIELIEEFRLMDKGVKVYLAKMAEFILNHHSVDEIIECHLPPYSAGGRKNIIINKLNELLKIGGNS